jgi:hypothetical protein
MVDVLRLAVLSAALCLDAACAQALAPPAPAAPSAPDVTAAKLLHQMAEELLALRRGGEAGEQAVAREVSRAFREAVALSQAGQHASAIMRLEALAPGRPLAAFPSYRIQAWAAITHKELGNTAAVEQHSQSAQAMLTLLSGGRTPDRPIALLHPLLIDDLVMRAQAQRRPLQLHEQSGRGPLLVLSFENDASSSKTRYLLPMPVPVRAVEPGNSASSSQP